MVTASIGLRIVEGIVDLVICLALFYIVALITGQATGTGFNLTGGPFAVAVVLAFAYYIVLEALFGATVGKLLLRLRVVKEESGKPIGWAESVARNAFRLLDGFLFYLVGFIALCFSKKHQRIGDRVAGTVVVKKSP